MIVNRSSVFPIFLLEVWGYNMKKSILQEIAEERINDGLHHGDMPELYPESRIAQKSCEHIYGYNEIDESFVLHDISSGKIIAEHCIMYYKKNNKLDCIFTYCPKCGKKL